jgi:uncharacterized protein (UPF0332 family)
VTPEGADHLSKARDDLNDTKKIAAIGLAKVAARSAYYAAYHTAQALIVERTGKIDRSETFCSLNRLAHATSLQARIPGSLE